MSPNDSLTPELIIGLVGPIGCDIQAVEKGLENALKAVDYKPIPVRVSDAISALLTLKQEPEQEFITLDEKIKGGNKVRRLFKNNAIFAADVIRQIRKIRAKENEAAAVQKNDDEDFSDIPLSHTAYIVRQLKRPEEVDLLRKTYGKLFIQVSITHNREGQIKQLTSKLKHDYPGWGKTRCEEEARRLIRIDENEEDVNFDNENISVEDGREFGQKLTEIFHLGDVFISSDSEKSAEEMSKRFINALFGKTNISPTRDEFGSYIAKAASLRSVDLSRQVGAAIITQEGDLVSIGCNEVPKPGGGNYWDEDSDKKRDIDLKGEANKEEMNRIIFDFLKTLFDNNLLRENETPESITKNSTHAENISKSLIGGITEYGRMVHAEMNAIADAARLGRSIKAASLYVTTFPCHNCAKHIIAAGINRVVYIEPYPKSRAEPLYSDAISTGGTVSSSRVQFQHFEGISPRRYRDIFEKGKRRNLEGEVSEWYQDLCVPRVGSLAFTYWHNEQHAMNEIFPEEVQ